MTVAVFVLYGDTMTADATMMVETCKWHGYEVIQLADDVAPRIAGVDHLFRAPIDMKKQELLELIGMSDRGLMPLRVGLTLTIDHYRVHA